MAEWTIELYGYPRLLAGRNTITVTATSATLADLVRALGQVCPRLVGPVISVDGLRLLDGYTFNLNGRQFVADLDVCLEPGDTVLLISSQAGG